MRNGHPRPAAVAAGLAVAVSTAVGCAPAIDCGAAITPLHEPVGACLRFGVSTPGGPTAVDEFERVAEIAGTPPTVVLSFSDFASPPPVAGLAAVRRLGADPIVTWEPWRWLGDGRYERGEFTMASIAAGVHDDYLYRWADELAAWGSTVYLRFAHEPNGTWYPWSPAGGTPPHVYVAAWRHVHELFASKGVANVKWVWAPNVSFEGSSMIADLYPGAEYVDVVGADGYNWGATQPWSRWTSPRELFEETLDELGRIAPGKPIVVTEVGSTDVGGSKPDWVGDLISFLDDRTDVAAFVWFDHDKETDWRLASTPEGAAALAEALQRGQR
ncbi:MULTISPECIES: glycoside hydrolase family 26 protein [Rhodococcus]|uniref:glycoside hydrolase family 26 protein n=1 Tax=Rhodococcus TaxID=1827 RepID=UPI000B03A80B|nr:MULTISPECIES: glycosyl hydrolase [Rhodococcus]MBC2587441.1 endoglucanase [Rhodococcus aetherivorans]